MMAAQITDAEIVAFLDGEASEDLSARVAQAVAEDPAMSGRVAGLQIASEQFRQDFEKLLDQAPEIPVPEFATTDIGIPAKAGWTGWRAVAAAAVLFVAGLGTGWTLAPDPRQEGWHQAVADYQVLYSNATLSNNPMLDDQRSISLARTSQDLGLSLTLEQVSVPGLEFQRAQILEFEGQPLAQLTYLDDAGNPIAFCLTASDESTDMRVQQLSGMNTVTWAYGGMGFILIGPATEKTLIEAQSALASQIKI